jgi:hypothetical protein
VAQDPLICYQLQSYWRLMHKRCRPI